jgi:hypothetical protein
VNRAQRIVLVIALGLALLGAAIGANLLMLDRYDDGWFSYAPNPGVTVSDLYFRPASDGSIVQQGLVWVVALAVWTAASVRLLRTPGPGGSGDG